MFVLLLSTRTPPTLQSLPPRSKGSSVALDKLEQVTANLKRLTAALWRQFSRKPRPIVISSSLLRLVPADLTGFGTPISTNANGVKAWVLDSDKLRAFVPPLDAIRDSQTVMVFEGGRASLAASIPLNSSTSVARTTFHLSYAPKIVSDGVRLDVAVNPNSTAPGGTDMTSIRARIPTAGALLLDCPTATSGVGRHSLFLFTPTIPPAATTPPTGTSALRPAGAYTTTPPHSQW